MNAALPSHIRLNPINRRFRNKCDMVEEQNSSSNNGIRVKFFSLKAHLRCKCTLRHFICHKARMGLGPSNTSFQNLFC